MVQIMTSCDKALPEIPPFVVLVLLGAVCVGDEVVVEFVPT
jgi:hypothetical protein